MRIVAGQEFAVVPMPSGRAMPPVAMRPVAATSEGGLPRLSAREDRQASDAGMRGRLIDILV